MGQSAAELEEGEEERERELKRDSLPSVNAPLRLQMWDDIPSCEPWLFNIEY